MTSTSGNDAARRRIPFTIDGEAYETSDLSQRAADLLRLAGRDPAKFDLGELKGKESTKPLKFEDDEIVEITKGAEFVTIRQSAPFA
ncbi:MAG: hypothetical protein OXI32_03305 [bacterium]|nr:hypothetical protein [bacterium]